MCFSVGCDVIPVSTLQGKGQLKITTCPLPRASFKTSQGRGGNENPLIPYHATVHDVKHVKYKQHKKRRFSTDAPVGFADVLTRSLSQNAPFSVFSTS